MSICSAMYTDHAFLQHLQTPLSLNWSGICDLVLATDDLLNCAYTASRKSMRRLWRKEKKRMVTKSTHEGDLCFFFVDDGAVHYHRPYLSGLSTKRSNSEEHKKETTSYWGKAPVELLGLLEQRPKEPGRKQPLAIGARHWLPTHSTV